VQGRHEGPSFTMVVCRRDSGTQSKLNMNEVLATRDSEITAVSRCESGKVHAQTTTSTRDSRRTMSSHGDERAAEQRGTEAAGFRAKEDARNAGAKLGGRFEHRQDRPHPSTRLRRR